MTFLIPPTQYLTHWVIFMLVHVYGIVVNSK